MHPWKLRLMQLWNTYKLQSYRPVIQRDVDHERLLADIASVLQQPTSNIESMWADYRGLMQKENHIEKLGQIGTTSSEEAFVIHCLTAIYQPPNLVEIGTYHGVSTRRILDSIQHSKLSTVVTCYDIVDVVRHFEQHEAVLKLHDVTDAVCREILDQYTPGIIYLDAHPWRLLNNVIREVIKRTDWILAMHDCSPILCNPKMTIPKDAPELISARTGHWERHVLADVFGFDDPLDRSLNSLETETHILRIFGTQHGLGLVIPKALIVS